MKYAPPTGSSDPNDGFDLPYSIAAIAVSMNPLMRGLRRPPKPKSAKIESCLAFWIIRRFIDSGRNLLCYSINA